MTLHWHFCVALLVATLGFSLGCTRPSIPSHAVEFPFEHPAAKEAGELFIKLKVYSEEDYRKLPQRDRYLWDVTWFETEVMNGGVDQYLQNDTGDHIDECLEALQAIGAKKSHSLLTQACSLFPERRPSANPELRLKQLRELTGEKNIDDLIQGEIEADLYRLMLNFYHKVDPKSEPK
jgi:hypothetical protein